jgi:hypothetical protein
MVTFGLQIPESDPTTWERIVDFMGNSNKLVDGKGDMSREGNYLTFAPLPQGLPSIIGAFIAAGGLKKLSQTPEGIKVIQAIAVKYLDTVGKIVSSMQHASAQNWLTALVNQWSCSNIYARLGLISPRDQLTTRLFLNHVFGEMLKLTYVQETLGAATTIVTSTNESKGKGEDFEQSTGLATLAKVAAGAL